MFLKITYFCLATTALFLFSGGVMDGIKKDSVDHVNSRDTTLASSAEDPKSIRFS